MDNNKADIIIIGGGVIGLSIAYFASCEGASVILVEKNRIPCGSSYGNAGIIAPSHCEPMPTPKIIKEGIRQLFDPAGAFTIRLRPDPAMFRWLLKFYRFCNEKHFFYAIEIYNEMVQESLRLHNDFASLGGYNYEYDQNGLLYLYISSKAFLESQKNALRVKDYGVESRVLSGDEIRNLDPCIGSKVVGAVHYTADGRLYPAYFLEWLAREATNRGARLLTETEVFGFEKNRSRIDKIYTTRGEFRGDQIVLAAGAWAPLLSKSLKVRLPIEAAKGYSLTFSRLDRSPRLPMILDDCYIAVTPYQKMLRMTGVLELSGLDGGINLKRLKRIQHHTRVYLPESGEMKLKEIWRGFRPCTPDDLPIIGKAIPFNNLWIAGGHGTKGMTLGPVTGRLMGDLLSGRSIGPLSHALRVNRF